MVAPFLRFSRDRHGYENTVLMHVAQPGARPTILYWYRSAPGVRVGRAALDEDAIRTIEEQHPGIDFDWPHILEVGPPPPPPDLDRRAQQSRRKPRRADSAMAAVAPQPASLPVTDDAEAEAAAEAQLAPDDGAGEGVDEPAAPLAPDMLGQLVGREIATRLRARYAEICARIDSQPFDEPTREAWRLRASALDPDAWVTPREIIAGIDRADALFDALRREMLGQ